MSDRAVDNRRGARRERGNAPSKPMRHPNWLRHYRLQANLTTAEMAEILKPGADRQWYEKYERGELRLQLDKAEILAARLGVPPLALIQGPEVVEVRAPSRHLSVLGEVAAGVWMEHETFDLDGAEPEIYPFAVPTDSRYDPAAMYVLRVRGNSINKICPDGSHLVCIERGAFGRSFQEGDWVVAQRRRGALVERTVKQVQKDDQGRWILQPASHDPRFQEPVRLGETDEEEVEVVAFVLDFLITGTRR